MPRPPLTRARLASSLLIGAAVMLAGAAVAVCMGPQGLSPGDLVTLFSDDTAGHILREARLTRVVLGGLCGAALSLAGASLQALLRNPLADPYVVGVSGGAAVGGTLAVVIQEPLLAGVSTGWVAQLTLPLGAYLGALAVLALIYGAARVSGRASAIAVLLSGVVFNAFCLALVSVMRLWVRAETAQSLMAWMMGSVGSETWRMVGVTAIYVSIGAVWIVRLAGPLHLLAQGDDAAARLGVSVERMRLQAYLATSLLVAGVVSVTGMIGFVGLMAPHLCRMIAGPDARVNVPLSGLVGAAALMVCDGFSRALFPVFDTEFPVGAFTSLLGGPTFLWLLRRHLGARAGAA